MKKLMNMKWSDVTIGGIMKFYGVMSAIAVATTFAELWFFSNYSSIVEWFNSRFRKGPSKDYEE